MQMPRLNEQMNIRASIAVLDGLRAERDRRGGTLGDTIEAHLLQAEKLFDNIEWCEPQKDYDRFCEINKANDSRRAVALFFVNLMKRDLVSKERIAELVALLLESADALRKLVDRDR